MSEDPLVVGPEQYAGEDEPGSDANKRSDLFKETPEQVVPEDGESPRPDMGSSDWYKEKAQTYENRADAMEHGTTLAQMPIHEVLQITGRRAEAAHLWSLSRIAAKLEARGIDPASILVEFPTAAPRERAPNPEDAPFISGRLAPNS